MSGQPPAPTPAQLEALFARLTDRGLTMAQIAELTDRQIFDVYGHERDDQGEVREAASAVGDKEAPKSSRKEEDRAALFGAGRALGVPLDVLVREWEKKYGNEPWEG